VGRGREHRNKARQSLQRMMMKALVVLTLLLEGALAFSPLALAPRSARYCFFASCGAGIKCYHLSCPNATRINARCTSCRLASDIVTRNGIRVNTARGLRVGDRNLHMPAGASGALVRIFSHNVLMQPSVSTNRHHAASTSQGSSCTLWMGKIGYVRQDHCCIWIDGRCWPGGDLPVS
jgi:hypothetical protein